MRVVTHILIASERNLHHFQRTNGLALLTSMLESLDAQSITHDLFIAVDDFCTFLRAPEQEELVDERLRNDLQQSLLLNWSIWSKGEKNVQQYVVDKVTKAMEQDSTLREAYASSFYLTYVFPNSLFAALPSSFDCCLLSSYST